MQLIQSVTSQPFSAPRPRVLVVDDSSLSRRILTAALTSTYDVVQANDGLEAIQRLEESQDFVCVVTDDDMPGCCGVEVADFVRRTPGISKIPVIVVTAGSASPTARQVEGHKAGAAVFIYKPVAPGQLLRLVQMTAKSRAVVATA